MKFPLCYICIKSGILCPRCQELIDRGEYDDLDLKIMKALLNLESKFPELKNVEYHKTLKIDNLVIVMLSNISRNIPWGKLSRALAESLECNAKFRFVEKTSDFKKIASQLLTPVRVLGVNILWLPDGSQQNIVRISKSEVRFLPADLNTLEQALRMICNTEVRIRVE